MSDLPPLVRRSVARLIGAFAPERIVLFGSYAKGTARAASDVDLLIISNFDANSLVHLRRARQLTADCFPPVDVVLATPADVANASSARSPFLLSILGSGRTIYTSMGTPNLLV
jgi:uncharacterized protein